MTAEDSKAENAALEPKATTAVDRNGHMAAPQDELAKLMLEHRLEVRRIWLDRFLIGGLLALAGLCANGVLERYKADNTRAHFLLTKRLEAASQIRTSLTGALAPLFRLTASACRQAKEDPSDFVLATKGLAAVTDEINSALLFLDDAYTLSVQRALSLVSGAAYAPCYASCDVREYLSHLAQFMTNATRGQIAPGESPDLIARSVQVSPPLAWSIEEMDRKGATAYFQADFERWRLQQGRSTVAGALVCRVKGN